MLPRDPKSTKKAKTIGLAFQGEFLLGLRKRKVVPNAREYVISTMSIIMDGYLQILRYMSDLKTGFSDVVTASLQVYFGQYII